MNGVCQYAALQLNVRITKLIFANVKKYSTREEVVKWVPLRLIK